MHMRGWDNVPFKLEPKCKFKVKRLQDQNYSTKQYISSPVDLGAMGLGTPRSIPLSTPCFITTLSTSIISMVTKPAVSYAT